MSNIQFGFCMPGDFLDKENRGTYVRDLNQPLTLVTGHFDSAWIIEYQAYGYPFPSNGTRVSQLEEALQIIRAMWVEERATFVGRLLLGNITPSRNKR